MQFPLFTVAFYTKDRYPAVLRAISSLDQTTPIKLPILVIEDQPKSRLRTQLLTNQYLYSRENFNILEIPKKSSCGQLMNLCIAMSEGRYVMFCNDDCVFQDGWFNVARRCLNEGYELSLLYNYGVCLLDKKVIPKIGWFDERFLGGNREDQDINIRVLLKMAQGVPIKYTNTWSETGDTLIKHEPYYYSSACWNGAQNEEYFKEKWGTLDYGRLCELAKQNKIKPKFDDVDWYPSYTEKFRKFAQ